MTEHFTTIILIVEVVMTGRSIAESGMLRLRAWWDVVKSRGSAGRGSTRRASPRRRAARDSITEDHANGLCRPGTRPPSRSRPA